MTMKKVLVTVWKDPQKVQLQEKEAKQFNKKRQKTTLMRSCSLRILNGHIKNTIWLISMNQAILKVIMFHLLKFFLNLVSNIILTILIMVIIMIQENYIERD